MSRPATKSTANKLPDTHGKGGKNPFGGAGGGAANTSAWLRGSSSNSSGSKGKGKGSSSNAPPVIVQKKVPKRQRDKAADADGGEMPLDDGDGDVSARDVAESTMSLNKILDEEKAERLGIPVDCVRRARLIAESRDTHAVIEDL